MTIVVIKHGGLSKAAALRAVSQAAAQRSATVVVVDDDDDLPWAKTSDPDPPAFVHVRQLTYAAILQALENARIRPTAVFTFMDPAVVLTARLAQHFQVPRQSLASLKRLKDKLQMREALRAAGFELPRFARVTSESDLVAAAQCVGFPLVLKPATGSAFKLGVVRIDSEAELLEKFRAASATLQNSEFSRFLSGGLQPTWMVESYLAGVELSVEVRGDLVNPIIVAVHEKTMTESAGLFREDQFITAPYHLDAQTLDQVRADATLAVRALEFDRGVAHLEMRVSAGRSVPLELQPVPGGGMVSQLTEWSCGINLHALHAQALIDEQPAPLSPGIPSKYCAMDVIYSAAPGVFDIAGIESAADSPGILAVQAPRRHRVRVSQPFSEYLGFIVAQASTSAAAVQQANDARRKIRIVPSAV